MLHARSITFTLPSSEAVTVESPLPEGLKDFIKRIRKAPVAKV
jgi:hypothetical protein